MATFSCERLPSEMERKIHLNCRQTAFEKWSRDIPGHIGEADAKRLALLPALALCLLICFLYVPLLRIRSDGGLLLLGASLSLFMGLFDVAVGRFVVKMRWEAILGDFDVRKGHLLGVGLVTMALCPLLAMRIARLLGGGTSTG